LREFTYTTNTLTSRSGDPRGRYETKEWLERVIIVGLDRAPSSVTMETPAGTSILEFSFDNVHRNHLLTIRKPGVNIASDFSISLSY